MKLDALLYNYWPTQYTRNTLAITLDILDHAFPLAFTEIAIFAQGALL